MLTREEIGRSLAGAARLVALDADGMKFFDVSTSGFFRSFRALLLILPLVWAVAVAEHKLILTRVDPAVGVSDWFVASRFLIAGLDWIAFPIVLAFLAPTLGVQRQYAGYIVAHNWTSVLAALLLSIPLVAYGIGLLGETAAMIIQLGLLIVWIRFAVFTARVALETNGAVAAGLVLLNIVLGLVIERAISAVIGV